MFSINISILMPKISSNSIHNPFNAEPPSLSKEWIEFFFSQYSIECEIKSNVVRISGVVRAHIQVHPTTIINDFFKPYIGCAIPINTDQAHKLQVHLKESIPPNVLSFVNWIQIASAPESYNVTQMDHFKPI